MKKANPLFIALLVLNILALVIVSILDYAWYQGVLKHFAGIYDIFTGEVSGFIVICHIFAKYAGFITFFSSVIFLLSAVYKNIWGLLVSLLMFFIQMIVMLYVMYGGTMQMATVMG